MSRVDIIETGLVIKELIERDSTKNIVIHHTGNLCDDDLSAAEIHDIHVAQGWAGIGYHFVVRKNGNVECGRPLNAVGSHAYGFNYCSIGIHVCGNFEIAKPTQKQLDILPQLIADLCDLYGLIAYDTVVVGHCDLMPTACPGKNLYSIMQDIRGNAEWYRMNI